MVTRLWTAAGTLTKYLKNLDHFNKSLHEVELDRSRIKPKEPIIVGFFILQYAQLRLMELFYSYVTKFLTQNLFEELEMDTYFLYLALAEEKLAKYIQRELKKQW